MAETQTPKTRNEEVEASLAQTGTESLPPAGHWRNEALKRRGDNLEATIEARAQQLFIESLDPSKMTIDNEIAYAHRDASALQHAKVGYHYKWVEYSQSNPSDRGQHIDNARMIGYEPVREKDSDAKGLTDRCYITPEGYIRWGSTILMRIKEEVFIEHMALVKARAMRRRGDAMNAERLVELGDKYGVKVHTELSSEVMQRAQQRHQHMQRVMAVRSTNQQAMRNIDRRLRAGNAHLPD